MAGGLLRRLHQPPLVFWPGRHVISPSLTVGKGQRLWWFPKSLGVYSRLCESTFFGAVFSETGDTCALPSSFGADHYNLSRPPVARQSTSTLDPSGDPYGDCPG